MRWIPSLFLLLILNLLAVQVNAKDGTILGKVRERYSQKELENVLVVAKSVTNGREIRSGTSSKGDYTFYNVTPDTYTLGFFKEGFLPIYNGQGGSPIIGLGHGHTAWANVFLDPNYSRVYGRLLDATGNFPISGARLLINGIGKEAFSDPSGIFSFIQIPAGNYTLTITAPGYTQVQNLAITVLGSPDTNLGDLRMVFGPYTLSGRITTPNPAFLEGVNGFPALNLQVVNYPQAAITLAKDRTGVFSINNLPGNNSYRLFPSLPGYRLLQGGTEVVVFVPPTNTIVNDIQLIPVTNEVRGVVRTKNGALATNGTVTITELGMSTPINFDGSYVFYGVPTEYSITFSYFTQVLVGNVYTAEVLNGFRARPLKEPIPFSLPVVFTTTNPLVLLRDMGNLLRDLSGEKGVRPWRGSAKQLELTRRALTEAGRDSSEEQEAALREFFDTALPATEKRLLTPFFKRLDQEFRFNQAHRHR